VTEPASQTSLQSLSKLVAKLRSPDGCPWDQKQGLADLRNYLLEEAHECAAAIDSKDWDLLGEELGDLLFQIVFIAELASESKAFDVLDVAARVEQKMIHRHPHVFGDAKLGNEAEVRRAWASRKLEESDRANGVLGGLSTTLPALASALRMTQKAADVGFDWPDYHAVLRKFDEERDELTSALEVCDNLPAVEEELGDLLFTVANLARHLKLDPEAALAKSNLKFRRRFGKMEEYLDAEDQPITETSLAKLESLWKRAKSEEKS
jgi:ATP diphosphatase